jgi:hypothetical protein
VDIDIPTVLTLAHDAVAQGDSAAAETYFQSAPAPGHDDADLPRLLGFPAGECGEFEEAANLDASAVPRS